MDQVLGIVRMIGKQLSRWTMAWFASAVTFLVLALFLAAAGGAGPGTWSGGLALAVVHLFVLGWLCQMMLGALIQFTPVLCARPLAWPSLSLPSLLLSAAGTTMLAAGFLSLDGWVPGRLLLAAPAFLVAGFGLAAAMLVPTLTAAQGLRQPEGRMVVLALIALAGSLATGTAMAAALSGQFLPTVIPQTLPLHILLGAGGFLSLAAFGVSYKLFAMFLLAPERDGPLRRAAFATAAAATGLTLGMAGLALTGRTAAFPALLAALLGAGTAALYLADIRRLWHSRRRPQAEVNMQWSRAALVFLALSAALLPPAFHLGGPWAEAAVFLALVGWLSTLTLAQMIKIVAFLTWIQIFAPLIGRQPVPLVAHLSDARMTARLLGLWSLGVVLGALSLALGQGAGFRVAALILLTAALGLGRELIAIRRLHHLDPGQRPDALPPLVRPVPLRSIPDDHSRTAGT